MSDTHRLKFEAPDGKLRVADVLDSELPIENTTDTLNWDSFYPQNI